MNRHALRVVRRAAAACGHRNVVAVARAQNLDDLELVPWPHDDVGDHVVEQPPQHRAVPEIVAALAPQGFALRDDGDVTQCPQEIRQHHG
ncbi:MAG: hypothetical protein WDO56_29760 [Gammaproteobacteria bacterium]